MVPMETFRPASKEPSLVLTLDSACLPAPVPVSELRTSIPLPRDNCGISPSVPPQPLPSPPQPSSLCCQPRVPSSDFALSFSSRPGEGTKRPCNAESFPFPLPYPLPEEPAHQRVICSPPGISFPPLPLFVCGAPQPTPCPPCQPSQALTAPTGDSHLWREVVKSKRWGPHPGSTLPEQAAGPLCDSVSPSVEGR